MSARHENETLQEYHERLKISKRLTKGRLCGLTVHDSRKLGTFVKPKAVKA